MLTRFVLFSLIVIACFGALSLWESEKAEADLALVVEEEESGVERENQVGWGIDIDEAVPGHVSRAHFSTILYATGARQSKSVGDMVARFLPVLRHNAAILKAWGSTFNVYTLSGQAEELGAALRGNLNMSLDDLGLTILGEDEEELASTIPLNNLPRDFNKALAPKARLLYAIARHAVEHTKSVVFLDADYLIARPEFFRIVLYERIAAFAGVPQMLDLWGKKHLNFLTPAVYNTGFFIWNAANISLSHMAEEFESIRSRIWTDQELFSQYIGRLVGMDREALSLRWNCRGSKASIEAELKGVFTYEEMLDKYCYGIHQRLDNYTDLFLAARPRFAGENVRWPPLE